MKKNAIGIDLGGTRVKIGLVSDDRIVDKKIVLADSANGLLARLPRIKNEIDELLKSNNLTASSLQGIGLAFPGLVDPGTKKILSTNKKYDDAPDLNMEAWVKENWGVPFFIDNDARMAAVGEWKYGAGKDTDNLVVMTIGTGIGTSAIIEGKLLRGKHFQAGCLGGHFSIQYNGKKCSCGNSGCMEAYGSTWSLPETVISSEGYAKSLLASVEVIDFAVLFEAAKNKDALAMQVMNLYMDIWSAGVVNLIHAYDPEVVVLGGGALNSQQVIIPYISRKVKENAWCPWGDVQIRATQLLSDAGILGIIHCLHYGV